MQLTTVKFVSIGLVLGASFTARGEWLNYVVRTSGLAWSDGYHAYDQCPPCQKSHWPLQHSFTLPGYSSYGAPRSEPYYFEERAVPHGLPNPATEAPRSEPLPSAPAEAAPANSSHNRMLPDPHARHQPRSRYFDAIRAESQGTELRQLETQQARRPSNLPPF
jgi:hypothetical protein